MPIDPQVAQTIDDLFGDGNQLDPAVGKTIDELFGETKPEQFKDGALDTSQKDAANETLAANPSTDEDPVRSGLLRDGMDLFRLDDNYHAQAYSSVHNAINELGYHNLLYLRERQASPDFLGDKEEATRDYIGFVDSFGFRDVPERVAKPLRNAFTLQKMLENVPLRGSYRKVAAASAGQKLLDNFVGRVQGQGTPLSAEQKSAMTLLETATREEWDDIYKTSVQQTNRTLKNDQERQLRNRELKQQLAFPERSLADKFGLGPQRPEEARKRKLRDALTMVFGGPWQEDYLNQYRSEDKLVKSAMLRFRIDKTDRPPNISELDLSRGRLTALDLVEPKLVQELFESQQKQSSQAPIVQLASPLFDDNKLNPGAGEFLQKHISDIIRDPEFEELEALTPFEKANLTKSIFGDVPQPVGQLAVQLHKAMELFHVGAEQAARDLDVALSKSATIQNWAKGAVYRTTGDKDAAGATRTLSDAALYMFRTAQQHESLWMGAAEVVSNLSPVGTPPAERGQSIVPADELTSFEAFRGMDPDERKAALQIFGSARRALEQAALSGKVEELGEKAKKFWSEDFLKGPSKVPGENTFREGLINTIGYGLGWGFQQFVLAPIADVMDDPVLAGAYAMEGVAMDRVGRGISAAPNAMFGKVYRSTKLKNYLRQIGETFPTKAREIKDLLQQRMAAAARDGSPLDPAMDDALGAARAVLDEAEAGRVSGRAASKFGAKVREVWPAIEDELGPLSSLLQQQPGHDGGVVTQIIRSIVPSFQKKQVTRDLMQALAPELNALTTRAIKGLVEKQAHNPAVLRGRARRLDWYQRLMQKQNLSIDEKIGLLTNDSRISAALEPRFAAERNRLAQLQQQLRGAVDEQVLQARSQALPLGKTAEMRQLQKVNEELLSLDRMRDEFRNLNPDPQATQIADLYYMTESLTSQEMASAPMRRLLAELYNTTPVQTQAMGDAFESLINLALEGAATLSQANQQVAVKGAFIDRVYKIAREKAEAEVESWTVQKEAMAALGLDTSAVDTQLGRFLARKDRLDAEWDRLFSVEGGEKQFRLDGRQRWALTRDMEVFKHIDDQSMYWGLLLDRDFTLGTPLETLFKFEKPEVAARTRGLKARGKQQIDESLADLEKAGGKLRKQIQDVEGIDSTLKILELRAEHARASVRRGDRTVPYEITAPGTRAEWTRRFNAAAAQDKLTPIEKEIHGFIKNRAPATMPVDNFGRVPELMDLLNEPQFGAALRSGRYNNLLQVFGGSAARLRRLALEVANRLDKKFQMRAPLLDEATLKGAPANPHRWAEFHRHQVDFGRGDPAFAESAASDAATRRAAVRAGEIVPQELEIARVKLARLANRMQMLRQFGARLDEMPAGRVPTLTDEGRDFMTRMLSHNGLDDVTERVVRRTEQLGDSIGGLTNNRINQVGLVLESMPAWWKNQFASSSRKAGLMTAASLEERRSRINTVLKELSPEARAAVGRAQAAGITGTKKLLKEYPELEPVLKDNPGLDDLLKFEGDLKAELIERFHRSGFIPDEFREDLLSKGYDPQLYSVFETARFVDDAQIKRVRASRSAGRQELLGGAPAAVPDGVSPDGLKFKRHLSDYRVRITGVDGEIVNQTFKTRKGAIDWVRHNYGDKAANAVMGEGPIRTHTNRLGETVKLADPIGDEIGDFLEPLAGPAATPEKRLLRWGDMIKNLALHDYLTTVRELTGLVLTPEQLEAAQLKHGTGAATATLRDRYVQLPADRHQFGNMAGMMVHEKVLKNMSAIGRTQDSVQAWMRSFQEAFAGAGQDIPSVLSRKVVEGTGLGKAFRSINDMARFNLITASWRTWMSNNLFSLTMDHMLGTRLFSLRNWDVRNIAKEHILRARGSKIPFDDIYDEFSKHGLLDQGFEAQGFNDFEADAFMRMLGLPDPDMKAKLARREELLRQQLEAGRRGPAAEAQKSLLEQQLVALNAIIDEQDIGIMRKAGREIAGVLGFQGRTALRQPRSKINAILRKKYSQTDTFYKYGFYRVLRTKMGMDSDTAAEQIRKFTQQFRDVPDWVTKLQQSPAGSFVVSFPYELARMTGNAIKDRPLRALGMAAALPMINLTMMGAAGIDFTKYSSQLEALGGRSATGAAGVLSTHLIVPGLNGEIVDAIDFGNGLFPHVNTLAGRNTMTLFYDNFMPEDMRTAAGEIGAAAASVTGAFVGSRPEISTALTFALGENPVTGEPLVSEGEGMIARLVGLLKTQAKTWLSPEMLFYGRDTQSLIDAYEAGIDPITKRPKGLGFGDALSRIFLNMPLKGKTAQTIEEHALGRQLGPKDAVNDLDLWRSLIIKSGLINEDDQKVRRVGDTQRVAAGQLYHKAALNRLGPAEKADVLAEMVSLLTAPRFSKPKGPFGGRVESRMTQQEINKFLRDQGNKHWTDQFALLDLMEKMFAIVHGDIRGLREDYLAEAARAMVLSERATVRRGTDVTRLEQAQKMMDEWLRDNRSRKHLFTTKQGRAPRSVQAWLRGAMRQAQAARAVEDRKARIKDRQIERVTGRRPLRP